MSPIKLTQENFVILDDSYLPQMAQLFKNAFAGEPWNDDWSDENQLKEYIKEISGAYNALNLGLVVDGKLFAMSVGMIRHWWEGTNYNIEELCVAPEYQHQGLGQQFLSMIEDYIKKMGVAGIFLQTDSDKPAYDFYHKNAFKDLGAHVSLYKSVRHKEATDGWERGLI